MINHYHDNGGKKDKTMTYFCYGNEENANMEIKQKMQILCIYTFDRSIKIDRY